MLNLTVLIVLFGSLIGMIVIISRKVSVLSELSPEEIEGIGVFDGLKNKIKNRIQGRGFFRTFSSEILLQKILSKFRVLTLKTENKTGTGLSQLRQRSLKKEKKSKKDFPDDYWQKLKKRTRKQSLHKPR